MSVAQPGPVRAPELDGAVAWLNVPAPLSLRALRGKVVLLDFWTYGCVNCIHVLSDLRRLEERFASELVVIGVHSAKFTTEKSTESIRRIIARYDIRHPVANDSGFRIWQAYAVRAWPTRVIIDPAGYVVGAASGEGNYDGFEEAIAAVVKVFDERGELNRAPVPLAIEQVGDESMPLRFPGKVLAAGGRLYISDSNHHRIVVAGTDGRVERRVGSGRPGRADGPLHEARFERPQGLAWMDGRLLVADTGNHLLRAVDFDSGEVTTIAGIGEPAHWEEKGGLATTVALSSPWDLAAVGPLLFIANAGRHQIWMMDVGRGIAWPYAGTGAEARHDGPIDESTFAQPSGLAADGDRTLYVADAESNIVRAIDLPPVNTVRTLAGGNLFEFGDRDGRGDEARFQHPLGVAWHAGRVLVADTYNHRIRSLDPGTREVKTIAGTGEPGHTDGPARRARFHEPGGLAVDGDTLYVADTNNHAIRTVDLRTGDTTTLSIQG